MEIDVHKICSVLDASTSNNEQQAISAILDGNKSILLDLSDCTYVSSAGLRVLLYSYKLATSNGQKLYLAGVSPEVKEVMAITGFERFFQFYDSVDDAKANLG